MNNLMQWFVDASIGQLILGIIAAALLIRFVTDILFRED